MVNPLWDAQVDLAHDMSVDWRIPIFLKQQIDQGAIDIELAVAYLRVAWLTKETYKDFVVWFKEKRR